MELLSNLAFGFSVAVTLQNLFYCFIGSFPRHADRRAAGHWNGSDGGDAAAADFQPQSGDRNDHARRHLLRRAVRRFDHRHPGQYPGRVVVGRHHHRRPSDGTAGARRSCARCRSDRVIYRRMLRDAGRRAVLAAAGGCRSEVRTAGLLLADGVRTGRRRCAGARLASQSDRDGGAGPAARSYRHRRQFR